MVASERLRLLTSGFMSTGTCFGLPWRQCLTCWEFCGVQSFRCSSRGCPGKRAGQTCTLPKHFLLVGLCPCCSKDHSFTRVQTENEEVSSPVSARLVCSHPYKPLLPSRFETAKGTVPECVAGARQTL